MNTKSSTTSITHKTFFFLCSYYVTSKNWINYRSNWLTFGTLALGKLSSNYRSTAAMLAQKPTTFWISGRASPIAIERSEPTQLDLVKASLNNRAMSTKELTMELLNHPFYCPRSGLETMPAKLYQWRHLIPRNRRWSTRTTKKLLKHPCQHGPRSYRQR